MKIVIDTDLNFPSDDFEALLLLLADPRIECLGCCAAAGNTWSEEVESNLADALRLAGQPEIPIVAGAEHGRFAPALGWARDIHRNGLRSFVGAYEKSSQPRGWAIPSRRISETVSQFVAQTMAGNSRQVQWVGLGPLTNLADALEQRPELPRLVDRVWIMGGNFATEPGDSSRIDFNVWFDPDAARRVFASDLRVIVLPLDVCRTARVTPQLIEQLSARSRQMAGLFVDDFLGMAAQHGETMPLCDQLLALVVRDPRLIVCQQRGRVHVESGQTAARGKTTFHPSADGNVELIRAVDVDGVHAALLSHLDAMERLACEGCEPLTTPRFQYLIQVELARSPVCFHGFAPGDGRVRFLETHHATEWKGFVARARGALELMARIDDADPPRHADSADGRHETARWLRGKRNEQRILENLATAQAVIFGVNANGHWIGLRCLPRPGQVEPWSETPRDDSRAAAPTSNGLTLVDAAYAGHPTILAMHELARGWRRPPLHGATCP